MIFTWHPVNANLLALPPVGEVVPVPAAPAVCERSALLPVEGEPPVGGLAGPSLERGVLAGAVQAHANAILPRDEVVACAAAPAVVEGRAVAGAVEGEAGDGAEQGREGGGGRGLLFGVAAALNERLFPTGVLAKFVVGIIYFYYDYY